MASDLQTTLLDVLVPQAKAIITTELESELRASMAAKLAELDAKLSAATTGSDLRVTTTVVTSKPSKPTSTSTSVIRGPKHKALPSLITIASRRLPILMVGMAGTGKTHAASQVATALSLPFYALSVGAQTSKSDLLGFMSASGKYVSTTFRQAFEHGGVFLLDELDAGNSNVLITLNAALSNGYCAFGDAMVPKHPDFVLIASANTYGTGASRQYVGRNQLDAATLDRFVVIDVGLDLHLESALAGKSETSKQWLAAVRAVRKHIDSEGIRALITPRATSQGAQLLEAGLSFNDVLQACILRGIPEDKHEYITTLASDAYGVPPTPDMVIKENGSEVSPIRLQELTSSPF